MGLLLRVLGLQALAALADAMPARTARVLTLALLVGANVVPLVALLTGAWQAGDVLVTYWLENVAIGIWQVVKLMTAQGSDPVAEGLAGPALVGSGAVAHVNGRPVAISGPVARVFLSAFFVMHYGMFTLVHGVFTFMLAHRSGTSGSVRSFAIAFLVLLSSHGLSTAIYWFGRGERRQNGVVSTMKQPYRRILVLHFAVIGSFFLMFGLGSLSGSSGPLPDTAAGGPSPSLSVLPGVLLIALKTALDAGLHLRAHRATARTVQAQLTPTG